MIRSLTKISEWATTSVTDFASLPRRRLLRHGAVIVAGLAAACRSRNGLPEPPKGPTATPAGDDEAHTLPARRYEAVRYELLRPSEVRSIRETTPIAYLAAGSLEWHSHHLPLGTDTLKAHAICCEAALRHGGIVIPPFYPGLLSAWGPSGWENYGLEVADARVFESVMREVSNALVKAGWRVIVGVTGHNVQDQIDAMRKAIEAATHGRDATGIAMVEGELHYPDQEIPIEMDHAAAWETACIMHVYPEKVDLNALKEAPWSAEEDLDMSGPAGIGGKNPLRYDMRELGRKIVERMADQIGLRARGLLESLPSPGETP